MQIKVIIPPSSPIRGKIRDTYTNLFRQFHRKYPMSRAYPRTKLYANIRNATSVGRITISDLNLRTPVRKDWEANGWLVMPCYHHWYFAVVLKKTKKGTVRAEIQDCCYEADYHNDVLISKPYESKNRKGITINESILKRVVEESIRKVLKDENKKDDCKADGKLGPYEYLRGGFRTIYPRNLRQFGGLNDIMMFFHPSQTYCLMRREDNDTYLFLTIVDAPERGEKETKFMPVKPKDVPPLLMTAARALIRHMRSRHNGIYLL